MVAFPLSMSSVRMYYFKWSTYSFVRGGWSSWCVDYILGRVVFFSWVYLSQDGVDAGMAVRTVL